jgi:hypothetical protein
MDLVESMSAGVLFELMLEDLTRSTAERVLTTLRRPEKEKVEKANEEQDNVEVSCGSCHTLQRSAWKFCPSCGSTLPSKLKDAVASTRTEVDVPHVVCDDLSRGEKPSEEYDVEDEDGRIRGGSVLGGELVDPWAPTINPFEEGGAEWWTGGSNGDAGQVRHKSWDTTRENWADQMAEVHRKNTGTGDTHTLCMLYTIHHTPY